ncbi:glycoside hydrolase [Achlya hypogyna]|uniref:glucan endo-1,3-beta-D-glucosidase n=1 Tax=Achlya hypogyna TaxID=1202772 RepID=A0A1V9YQ69_ACHHY|nr:glycoside hydrolase [Achlya hypogyna]
MDSQLVASMVEAEDFTAQKTTKPRFWQRKRLAGLVAALAVVGTVIGVVVGTTGLHDAGADAQAASMGASNLGMAVCYDTYQSNQIDAHFTKLATRFSGVRSFQTWIPNDNVIDAAARHNLLVYAGIWVRGPDYNKDVQAAIDGAKRHPSNVKAVFVGNEDLSNGWSVGQLLGAIRDVRGRFQAAGLGYIKIGTVQIDGDLLAHPEVAAACDVVGVNIHPFFGGAPVSWTNPIMDVDARWNAIYAKFGNKAVITETGWPFAGGSFGQHIASYANAINYFNAFRNWANTKGGDLPVYFMYHDNQFKGGFEANFAVADANANWKFDFVPLTPNPNPGPNPSPTPAPTVKPALNRYQLPFLLQTARGKMVYEMYKGLFAYDEATCANERWRYNLGSNQLVSESSGQCLDAYRGANNQFYVHVWPCDATNGNQKWNVDVENERIVHMTHANLCLDVDPTKPDASVQVWGCTGGINQKLVVNPDLPHLGIGSRKTGNVLAADGTAVFFRPLEGSFKNVQADKTATWTFVQSQNMIKHEASGKCLDAYEAKDGGAVHLWACDTTNSNQKWTYDAVNLQLRHATHDNFCLDMASDTGEKPHIWSCHGAGSSYLPFQQFSFVM